MEDRLAEARATLHAAQAAFDAATEASLTACTRQAALNVALSWIPFTRTAVNINVIRIAGRSKYDPVVTNPV